MPKIKDKENTKKEKKSESKEVGFSRTTQIRHLEKNIAQCKADQEELNKEIIAMEHEKNTIMASSLPIFKDTIAEMIQGQIDELKEEVEQSNDDMKDLQVELQDIRNNK